MRLVCLQNPINNTLYAPQRKTTHLNKLVIPNENIMHAEWGSTSRNKQRPCQIWCVMIVDCNLVIGPKKACAMRMALVLLCMLIPDVWAEVKRSVHADFLLQKIGQLEAEQVQTIKACRNVHFRTCSARDGSYVIWYRLLLADHSLIPVLSARPLS